MLHQSRVVILYVGQDEHNSKQSTKFHRPDADKCGKELQRRNCGISDLLKQGACFLAEVVGEGFLFSLTTLTLDLTSMVLVQ